jgi:hypothetical protein
LWAKSGLLEKGRQSQETRKLALYPFEESNRVTFARQKGNNSQKSIKTQIGNVQRGYPRKIVNYHTSSL